jgi:hypothetical protein
VDGESVKIATPIASIRSVGIFNHKDNEFYIINYLANPEKVTTLLQLADASNANFRIRLAVKILALESSV